MVEKIYPREEDKHTFDSNPKEQAPVDGQKAVGVDLVDSDAPCTPMFYLAY
jgi:hypothetical protein